MSITSHALKIGAVLLLTSGFSQLLPEPAQAGCFSDDCSNKRAAEASRDRTLRYGGTYPQAANDYWNRRYGSGAPGYYNPNSYRSGAATTNQSANCQNLAQGYYSATNQMAKNIAAQVYNQYCSQ